jgi:non-ribosomal peptide synthetase component F
MQERYQPTARDRFTQIIDLTFDLSIHDIFLCWSVGACLLGFSGSNYFQLAAYLKNERPTFSLMVPSTALALMRSRLLKENDYASLVTVLFCGEALPVALAKQWQLASPKARVENIYGPTEATIAFTAYQYSESDLKLQQQALVPIGQALPGLRTKVVRQDFTDCEIDEAGELLLAGPQLVSGYVNNLQKTVKQFIYLQGRIWYRTGDLACLDNSGNLHYQGRLDQQLQIRGQRVERLDLEERFKKSLNLQHLVIIPSPVTEEGLVLGVALIFLTMEEVSVAELRKRCQNDSELAFFPSEYIALDSFPLNRNSKVDYQALVRRYQKTDKMSSKEKVLV